MQKIFFSLVLTALLTLGVGVYLLWGVFFAPSTHDRYVETFPSAGTSTPVDVINTPLPPQLLIATSGEMYSATPLVVSSSTEQLDHGLYTLTDDPETYDIFYNEPTGIILISLYKEPLSFSRALAERKLLETLKLTKEQICKLQVKVTTNTNVSSVYGGENLGLSFCPSSVSLQ